MSKDKKTPMRHCGNCMHTKALLNFLQPCSKCNNSLRNKWAEVRVDEVKKATQRAEAKAKLIS